MSAWIKVEDRVPEVGLRFRANVPFSGPIKFKRIDGVEKVGAFYKGRNENYFESEEGFLHSEKDILAWQPLPEPYKPEESK